MKKSKKSEYKKGKGVNGTLAKLIVIGFVIAVVFGMFLIAGFFKSLSKSEKENSLEGYTVRVNENESANIENNTEIKNSTLVNKSADRSISSP